MEQSTLPHYHPDCVLSCHSCVEGRGCLLSAPESPALTRCQSSVLLRRVRLVGWRGGVSGGMGGGDGREGMAVCLSDFFHSSVTKRKEEGLPRLNVIPFLPSHHSISLPPPCPCSHVSSALRFQVPISSLCTPALTSPITSLLLFLPKFDCAEWESCLQYPNSGLARSF